MTADDAATLAQGATARPWTAIHGSIIENASGAYVTRGSLLDADAAFIVYAVNHIEQAEAERDEALRYLDELHDALFEASQGRGLSLLTLNEMAHQIKVRFLRRHDAQPGGGG